MVEVDGAFRTQDLALVVVLASEGYTYTHERTNSHRCQFVFDCPVDREEDFDDLIDAYEGGNVKVEPRSFVIEQARVRDKMMRFLGVPNRRRRPGSDAPSAQTA